MSAWWSPSRFIGCCKRCAPLLEGHNAFWFEVRCDEELVLHGFTNSSWVGNASVRGSTLGCCCSLGLGMISWFNMKETSMVLSSTKAEHMMTSSIS